MAAAAPSSCIGTTLLLNTTTNSRSTDLKYSPPSTLHSEGHCSVLRRSSYLRRSSALRRSVNSPSSYKYSVVRNATPEAAGDLLSSLAGIPDISLLGDNPWLAGAGAAGLSAAVPLTVQRLLKLRKWVNTSVEPVEVVAEAPPQPAQKVEELMEKVKELDEKLEALLNKHSNSTNISVNINCFGNSERLQ